MREDHSIKIAGKSYKLRYRLEQRDEIERAGDGAPLLQVIISGKIRDQATVVWAGIRGANPAAKVTPRGLIEAFQQHNDKGGDYYQDVFCPAVIALGEAGLLGRKADIDELKRMVGYEDPEGKDEAGGAPESVRAAE